MARESIKKIKEKFKDEWVLLSDYELNECYEPISGVVIAHSKDRDEIYDKLKKEMPKLKKLCIEFMGDVPPKDVVIIFYGES